METKRIGSTVALIFFLAFVCFLCWLSFRVEAVVKAELANPTPYEPTDDVMMDYVGAVFLGAVVGFTYLIGLAASVLVILNSAICLGFAIRNTRVENCKPVRVINIIYSCLFALGVAAGITALILLLLLRG